ncbi:MAG: hypothetical protein R6X21_06545 [Candidatus Aminicenantes bacterium]
MGEKVVDLDARDLKPLLAEAYELADIKVYDFFPHTPHIECLAIIRGHNTHSLI